MSLLDKRCRDFGVYCSIKGVDCPLKQRHEFCQYYDTQLDIDKDTLKDCLESIKKECEERLNNNGLLRN